MKNTLLILFIAAVVGCGSSQAQKKLSPAEFQEKLEMADEPQLVDVRTPGEFNSGHIQGSVNININDATFKAELNKLDKSKPLYLYCGSGVRSAKAAGLANDYGFTVIFDLAGGIGKWSGENLPVQK